MNIYKLAYRSSSLKTSKGFEAVANSNIRSEIISLGTPKLDALAEVLISLKNQ